MTNEATRLAEEAKWLVGEVLDEFCAGTLREHQLLAAIDALAALAQPAVNEEAEMAAFKAWGRREDANLTRAGESYENPCVASAWDGYQAARRAALEEADNLCNDGWHLLTRHECADAIRAVRVSIVPLTAAETTIHRDNLTSWQAMKDAERAEREERYNARTQFPSSPPADHGGQ